MDPATGAVTPPIHLSTTFARAPDGALGPQGFLYARQDNPTRRSLERCLAELEGGAGCAAFASGAAATAAIFQSLRPGDHVIAPHDAYHGSTKLLRELFAPWGLEASLVEMTDAANVERALRPTTRLVWVESPSNPMLRITDIARVAEIARAHGARTAVDATWATPAITRPLALGADLVMHATTKYLGGHSDTLGGAVIAREEGDEMFARIRQVQTSAGAVPSPFECWLVLRGVRTLPWRMRAHSANAAAVARMLAAHPKVARVHYPGLASHAGHAIAARQMALFGGMLSFEVRSAPGRERETALGVAARCRLFTRATSLGGSESLIEHRASVEPPESGTPETLLRLSVGLEHESDLLEDLERALG